MHHHTVTLLQEIIGTHKCTLVKALYKMIVVIDPVYVQMLLRPATRFIPFKAFFLVVTFGERNEPYSTSLSLWVP